MTKQERLAFRHYSAESDYNAAQEKLRKLEEIEAERCLDDWEEIEKKEALENVEYYGILWAKEIERERQELCRIQGLSRWC